MFLLKSSLIVTAISEEDVAWSFFTPSMIFLFSRLVNFSEWPSRGVFITFHALENRLITLLMMKRLLFIVFPIVKYESPFLNKFIIIFRPQRSFLSFATDFVLFDVFFQEQVTG